VFVVHTLVFQLCLLAAYFPTCPICWDILALAHAHTLKVTRTCTKMLMRTCVLAHTHVSMLARSQTPLTISRLYLPAGYPFSSSCAPSLYLPAGYPYAPYHAPHHCICLQAIPMRPIMRPVIVFACRLSLCAPSCWTLPLHTWSTPTCRTEWPSQMPRRAQACSNLSRAGLGGLPAKSSGSPCLVI